MSLNNFYGLRKNFTIIGLTGRVGSGCTEVSEILSNEKFNKNLEKYLVSKTDDIDELKLNICIHYLKNNNNWIPFKVIKYESILILHLLFESWINTTNKKNAIGWIIKTICQNGKSSNSSFENRLDIEDEFIPFIKNYLKEKDWFDFFKNDKNDKKLYDFLDAKKTNKTFFEVYFKKLEPFIVEFIKFLNSKDITKSTRLYHDLANNLRENGSCENAKKREKDLNHIYIVAETINRLIKIYKQFSDSTKIVIDSLKNSLELMYFKEKYSAFYTVALNKSSIERNHHIKEIIKKIYPKIEKKIIDNKSNEIIQLDDSEYKGKEVNEGEFSSPDIENCIQKSDYHIFWSKLASTQKKDHLIYESKIHNNSNLSRVDQKKLKKELDNYSLLDINKQLLKLVALIHQPGIITPTAYERNMQTAHIAKLNSGCISRQVGAVVSDISFSIKAIGWNDVPRFQVPCNLRNVNDLINDKNTNHFSDFEKGLEDKYKDDLDFKSKIKKEFEEFELDKLEGKNCSFCFKSFHNAFEGKENQVHTRSLHAEENAMLQISKYGGQGIKNGNLFTTASPCELCSKKAFQLGVKRIYYIDPYPGIATKHVLKGGKSEKEQPQLLMFQGAIGKAYQKLYEPFISYKDELFITSKVKPKKNRDFQIEQLTEDKKKREEIKSILDR